MRVATHSGSFHADEVFALAALSVVHGPLDVVRSRDDEVLAGADARVDVGLRDDASTGDFDHHQQGGAGVRPNGIRYASFGLVWRHVGVEACGGDAEAAALVDETLVQGVDALDTGQELSTPLVEGVRPMTVSDMIAAVNPRWDEPDDDAAMAARFAEATAIADGILRREISGALATRRAHAVVEAGVAAAADPRIVELDRGVPWHRAIHALAPEALFVIVPKSTGWGVQAVPATLGQFRNRRDLPEAWAGLQAEDLARVSGVADATFCHSARFLAVARTPEGARDLARLALED